MIIDRFEGEYAVIELNDKTFVNIPKIILPRNAKEGDSICVSISKVKTDNRELFMQNKLDCLFKD